MRRGMSEGGCQISLFDSLDQMVIHPKPSCLLPILTLSNLYYDDRERDKGCWLSDKRPCKNKSKTKGDFIRKTVFRSELTEEIIRTLIITYYTKFNSKSIFV